MHWSNSGRHAQFLMVDARASYPLLVFIVHISYWTLSLWLISLIVFGMLRYKGFTVPTALRTLRTKAAGRVRYSKPWWRRPEMVRTPIE